MTDGFLRVGTNGLQLHYQAWGPPDASRTVVLVHGLASSCHIWDLIASSLVAQYGVRVVALDQRGHGLSDQPDTGYDFGSIVADLAGFCEGVGVREPAVMVGHSWGASVVLHFGVQHPDRTAGVVLVDGGTGSPGERSDWPEAERRMRPPDIDGMRWADLRERMSSNNGAFSALDPAFFETFGASLFEIDAAGLITRRFRIPNHMQVVRALWEQRPAELLPRLQAPLLILPARRSTDAPEMQASKVAGVERALELHPHARVRWFEETVHDIPLQRPAELATEIGTFAGSVLPLPTA